MGRKYSQRDVAPLRTLGVYSVWLVLASLSAWVAWQLHASLLYLATLWLQSDLPRPPTWNSSTLVGLSRLSLLMFGSLWLVWILYLEGDLRQNARRQRLLARSLRIVLVGMGILAAVYLALWLAT